MTAIQTAFEGEMLSGIGEEFDFDQRQGLSRTVSLRRLIHQQFRRGAARTGDHHAAWWRAYLREPREEKDFGAPALNVVDLFSSVGGLTLGFQEAAQQLGFRVRHQLAVDVDRGALDVFSTNHAPRQIHHGSVADLVSGRVVSSGDKATWASTPQIVDLSLSHLRGNVDVVIAGPPCQGHSTLNNHTRGADPRNRLYLTVPAFAVATGARAVVIENVSNVVNDSDGVVASSISLLESSGYFVTCGVLSAHKLGWPQTRRRFFLVATRDTRPLDLPLISHGLEKDPLPLSWAIGDLVRRRLNDQDVMNSVPELSEENKSRIQWLFDNDEYVLPDRIRPKCHQDGTHTYGSVYGRMHWDKPSGTITGGFLTPGRGRFIHPRLPRVLTPREAARVQGFPDWFNFQPPGISPPRRASVAKWIGDAVPPILGYVAGLAAVSGLGRSHGPVN